MMWSIPTALGSVSRRLKFGRRLFPAALVLLAGLRCGLFTDSEQRDARIVWERPFPTEGSHTTPLVLDSLVVFATRAGTVVAVDRRSGVIRWEQAVLAGQPILARVMAAAAGRVLVPAIRIVALDLATGAEAWTFDAPPDDVGDESIVVVGDTLALVTGALGWLYAIDARTGNELWRVNVGERPFGLVAPGPRLYFGTRARDEGGLGAGHLIALNLADRTEAWRVFVPDRAGTSYTGGSVGFPAIVGSTVFYTTVPGRLYAVNEAAGDTLWTHEHSGSWNSYYAGPVMVQGRLVALRYDGVIAGFDPATGSQQWVIRLRAPPSSPVSDGQRVFVSEGAIRGITANGETVWRFPAEDRDEEAFTQPPAVRDGVVYVAGPRSLLAVRAYP